MPEIVEEWNYYDGFREGIVRIGGTLYYAVTEDYSEPVWRFRARSLFHAMNPIPNTAAIPDPGLIEFTSEDLVRP